ncbi:MAG: NAD(P)H-quinone oxidoreductase [Balneolaceae bacterium]
MKALLVDSSADQPKMVLGDHPSPKPAAGELLVKIEATALNRADLLQKAGKYPPPEGTSPILGLEMAGTVEEVGEGVTLFEKGDAVFGLLPGGGYAEYCTIHEELAMPVPESVSIEEAAGIAETFLTAFQALLWNGEIYDGETVLIHAGAGGVGTSAIQLAKQVYSAEVIATAGSQEKLKLCKSLGADLAINYKEQDFAEVIETELGENSVDLIVDFVGSEYWNQNMDVLAMDGRLIHLALLGGATVEKMSLVPILRKRLTVRGSTLRNRSDLYKKLLTEEFTEIVFDLIASGKIKPIIDSVYNWSDADKAHDRMAKNLNAGKIILNGM